MKYSVDARYRRHIEAAFLMAVREVAQDASYRARGLTPKIAPVSNTLYDPDAIGTIEITITENRTAPAREPDATHYEKVGASLS